MAASFIQGITLAGVMFDEVALQPESFVEQAIARCSVTNSKLWFNCNPEGTQHWFYKKWIENPPKIKTLYPLLLFLFICHFSQNTINKFCRIFNMH